MCLHGCINCYARYFPKQIGFEKVQGHFSGKVMLLSANVFRIIWYQYKRELQMDHSLKYKPKSYKLFRRMCLCTREVNDFLVRTLKAQSTKDYIDRIYFIKLKISLFKGKWKVTACKHIFPNNLSEKGLVYRTSSNLIIER